MYHSVLVFYFYRASSTFICKKKGISDKNQQTLTSTTELPLKAIIADVYLWLRVP